ncbi:MAG: UTRA domain-containing protein, partial [Noviherbaspirillum sp.]
ILAAHPGIGTVVRSKPGAPRLVQGVTSVAELLQFVEATRMQAMAQREIVADDGMAALLGCSPGQHWFEVTVLRTLAGLAEPLAQVLVYLRPEHADVIAHIDASTQPIFTMIESRHGTRVAEVSQEITPVALTRPSAQLLQAAPGCPALQIVRRYFDAQDRIILVSVGLYPGDRFSHSTRFRVQREARV